MPVALVKSIFQHFSKAKLTKGAVEAIQNRYGNHGFTIDLLIK